MNAIQLTGPSDYISGTLRLPGSKSISNRVLIIRALCDTSFNIDNLSPGSDTTILNDILLSQRENLYVGHGGTTLRFAMAFLAIQEGRQRLTGTDRLNKRPVKELVDALNSIGCRIEYENEKNELPVIIHPFESQKNDTLILDASVSSQFVSALCLIAPSLPKGLNINLKSGIVSKPYIEMTLALMKKFGIESFWDNNRISIGRQKYIPGDFKVESDWSAAGYFYALASAYEKCDLILSDFFEKSDQGDRIIMEWGKKYGVDTKMFDNKIHLTKSSEVSVPSEINFIQHPDLVQTITMMSMMKGYELECSGLDTLPGKETNRIEALKNEIEKFGLKFMATDTFKFKLSGEFKHSNALIETYDDHRMAMAFSTLAAKGPVCIMNPGVVSKSYPGFWNDLSKLGFQISIT